MFACLRISHAPLTHAYAALRVRALSTTAPLFNVQPQTDEPAEAIHGAALPSTLLEKPKSIHPNQFTSPHEFTREHRIARSQQRRKDPTLGPSRKHAQAIDAFRKLDIDPLDEFKNPLLLKAFVTEMGKIHSRAKTGLTWRSQRRVGKAIRRARALGLIPLWNTPTVYDSSLRPLPDWTSTRPTRSRLR
ncbi:ribosomal protein S18 [Rhizoctonia solani]|nr:ribosomal protein S18 [Rhizoctonia solani]